MSKLSWLPAGDGFIYLCFVRDFGQRKTSLGLVCAGSVARRFALQRSDCIEAIFAFILPIKLCAAIVVFRASVGPRTRILVSIMLPLNSSSFDSVDSESNQAASNQRG